VILNCLNSLIRFLLVSFLLLAATASMAQSGRQQLNLFLETLTSYQADFQQQVLDERLNLIEQAQGHLQLQRPGRMRWEYKKPLPTNYRRGWNTSMDL